MFSKIVHFFSPPFVVFHPSFFCLTSSFSARVIWTRQAGVEPEPQ